MMALHLTVAFLLPILSAGLVLSSNAPGFIESVCRDIRCNASVTYQDNLNQLFVYLHANASLSGFHTATAGQGRDRAYGLALCREDIPGSNCSDCILQAIENSNQTCCSYHAWYDYCLLRFSTENLIGKMENTSIGFSGSGGLVPESARFKRHLMLLMAHLTSSAASNVSSGLMFATEETGLNASTKIYGLVMCTRDISFDGCRLCLEGLFSCADFFAGWANGQSVTQSCSARYSLDPLFLHLNVSAAPPPGAPPSADESPKETSGAQGLMLSGISLWLPLMFALWNIIISP